MEHEDYMYHLKIDDNGYLLDDTTGYLCNTESGYWTLVSTFMKVDRTLLGTVCPDCLELLPIVLIGQ